MSSSATREVAKLTAPDAAAGEYFGASVALSGDTVIVGATEATAVPPGPGAVYVFQPIAIGAGVIEIPTLGPAGLAALSLLLAAVSLKLLRRRRG